MNAPTHTPWCTDHLTERDGTDVSEVCRRAVTFGEATVELEHCPTWVEDTPTPIVLPEIMSCDAQAARDLSVALLAAASLLEAERREDA